MIPLVRGTDEAVGVVKKPCHFLGPIKTIILTNEVIMMTILRLIIEWIIHFDKKKS